MVGDCRAHQAGQARALLVEVAVVYRNHTALKDQIFVATLARHGLYQLGECLGCLLLRFLLLLRHIKHGAVALCVNLEEKSNVERVDGLQRLLLDALVQPGFAYNGHGLELVIGDLQLGDHLFDFISLIVGEGAAVQLFLVWNHYHDFLGFRGLRQQAIFKVCDYSG